VRHAGEIQIGDLAANAEVDDLAFRTRARGAENGVVILVEEKVVENVIEHDLPHRQRAGFGDGLLVLVVVHQAFVDRAAVVGDFPDFRMSFSAAMKLLRGRAS